MTPILSDILSGYIEKNFGTVVVEQFERTFGMGEDFEDQNEGALLLIKKKLSKLPECGVFEINSIIEIKDYLERLDRYLRVETDVFK